MRPSPDPKDGPPAASDAAPTPRRHHHHRSSAKIRLDGGPPTLLEPTFLDRDERTPVPIPSRGARHVSPHAALGLAEDVRASLWRIVAGVIFGHDPLSQACLRRVWASSAFGGRGDRIPDDAAELVGNWFALVEPPEVYAFVESVFDQLEPPFRGGFATTVNGVLEAARLDHRFVVRRLLPVSARTDITAIERAIAVCKSAHWDDTEAHLVAALGRFAAKPIPDVHGAIARAVRCVEIAATTLTRQEQPLDANLELLEARGLIPRTLKSAYAGLFTHLLGERTATVDDARLVIVMCAGFINHLALHGGHVANR